MTKIIEFLEARIAEDERWALKCKDAYPTPWELVDRGSQAYVSADEPNYWKVSHLDVNGTLHMPDENAWPGEYLRHVDNFNPDRALAECKAKRAIIAAYQDDATRARIYREARPEDLNDQDKQQHRSAESWAGAGEVTLRFLAQIYTDHPDFDPEWAVTT